MKIFKRIAFIIFILIIGATAGSYATRTVIMKEISILIGGPSVEKLPRIIQRLEKRLDLNEEQKEDITEILTIGLKEMQQVRDEYNPHMKQVREKTRGLILEKLNEKQKYEFNVMTERLKEIVPFE
jgi:hypothetical protein